MPIRKEMRARYPSDWADVSLRIREREGGRCRFCGVQNNSLYTRDQFYGSPDSRGRVILEGLEAEAVSLDGAKISRIVLTVAHLNHIPEDCRDENLAALCQSCHLEHDREQHRATRAARLDAGRTLFGGE